jgi:hypothetical protein
MIRQDNFRSILRQAHEAKKSSLSDLLGKQNSSIHAQSRQRDSIQLITDWLNTYEHDHSQTYSSFGTLSEPSEIGILLVDVVDRRLIQSTTFQRYFALSYV